MIIIAYNSKDEIKNLIHGGVGQTSILNYFFNSWILCNIYCIFMKLLIYARCDCRDQNFKKIIIYYYDRKVY